MVDAQAIRLALRHEVHHASMRCDEHVFPLGAQAGKVVDVDVSVALEAADTSLAEKLAMADSLILATARLHQATLWTQDAHFDGLAGVKYIKKR